MLSTQQNNVLKNTMTAVSGMLASRPILYGPDNRPVASYQFSRTAAKRTGTMKNWVPKRLLTRSQEAFEREKITERAIDLVNSDPNATGMLDTFPTTIIGAGLVPHPSIDFKTLGLTKDAAQSLQRTQKNIYLKWAPYADAGGRMSAGAIQFLLTRNLIQYGEFLVLLPMISDPLRPYSLACQVINPLRLKTPTDLVNEKSIKDGVVVGKFGDPVAYWIKKANQGSRLLWSDHSKNFIRVPAKRGHRWSVLHGFINKDPEQVRGISAFAPAMKMFRDFSDLLDAELVSNIVTAAFSLFIETGADGDPGDIARFLTSQTDSRTNADGNEEDTRYQEMIPGQIMYGNTGQKPHALAASRPGTTFEPFTKVIKKSVAMALGLPYPVAFKDVEGVNFAGFRSAMIDAWRVFMFYRTFMGRDTFQKIYGMVQEEAYLNGEYFVENFYQNYHLVTACEFVGPPKGDIEPIKAVNADVIAINNHLKTRERAITERGGGEYAAVFDQLEEEQNLLDEKGLKAESTEPAENEAPAKKEDDE